MKLSALLLALLLVGCGLSTDTEKTLATQHTTTETVRTTKQVDVCITDSSGVPIASESGVCWNPGYKSEVTDIRPILPASPPPPAPAPAPARTYSDPTVTYSAVEESRARMEITRLKKLTTEALSSPKTSSKPRPYVPKIKPTPKVDLRPVRTQADAVLDQLALASVAFVIPDRANINDKIPAELLVDFASSAKELETQLSIDGKISSGQVLVSKIVSARLFAPDFTIVAISPEKQALTSYGATKWAWELMPLKSGTHEVVLSISAQVKVDGSKAERYIGTYNKKVLVHISSYQVTKAWFSRNWQWVGSTLIIPFAIYGWQRRKKRLTKNSSLS